ncbi:hypothetical protein ACJX0J_007816, partial [Zea mays]
MITPSRIFRSLIKAYYYLLGGCAFPLPVFWSAFLISVLLAQMESAKELIA